MSDQPFYRGFNLMDWWFGVSLQTACDWFDDIVIQQTANALGDSSVLSVRFPLTPIGSFVPNVFVVTTPQTMFVVSGSTKGGIQWVGNLLGSFQSSFTGITGNVAAYFATVANAQFSQVHDFVNSTIGSRQLVILGFSLGASSALLLRELFLARHGLSAAVMVFGCPRTGDPVFAGRFPNSNFARLIAINDPVGSVPPVIWSSVGSYLGWVPAPPLAAYQHVGPSYVLSMPSNVVPGDFVQPISEVALGFDSGIFEQFHNQSYYARILRSGLPQTIPTNFQGYSNSQGLDTTCQTVFGWSPVGWPFGQIPPTTTTEVVTMGCQGVLYIRDAGGAPLGFQEVYYFNGTDPQSLDTNLNNIANDRVKILSRSCEIYARRVSVVGGPRQSFLTKYKVPMGGKVAGDTDKIEAAIVYFLYSAGRTHKRQIHLRGIPSSWIDTDVLTPLGNSQLSSVEAYLSGLAANNVSILLKRSGTTYNIVSGSQPTQNSLITLTLDNTFPGVSPGTPLIISGCKPSPLLNGSWVSVGTSVSPNQVTLSGSQRYSCPASLSGKLTIASPQYIGISDLAFNGVANHKTGRPSFLQRGRRSAQLKHR